MTYELKFVPSALKPTPFVHHYITCRVPTNVYLSDDALLLSLGEPSIRQAISPNNTKLSPAHSIQFCTRKMRRCNYNLHGAELRPVMMDTTRNGI